MLDFTLHQMGYFFFFAKLQTNYVALDMFLLLLLFEIEPILTNGIAMQQFVCHYSKIHMNT